jgi:hypothetical protein
MASMSFEMPGVDFAGMAREAIAAKLTEAMVGADDARELVSYSKNPASVHVHRVTEGEIVRDVTADFFPEEDEAPEYRINRTAAMRRAGAFGRA